MWNLPRPGIEPTSSALAGGFLPTVPPGKSQKILNCMMCLHYTSIGECCFRGFWVSQLHLQGFFTSLGSNSLVSRSRDLFQGAREHLTVAFPFLALVPWTWVFFLQWSHGEDAIKPRIPAAQSCLSQRIMSISARSVAEVFLSPGWLSRSCS